MQYAQIQQFIFIWLLPLIFAITLHEVAHGWVADKLGDPTAKMLGRLTLNPIKHIDPFGTILVPAALFFFSGFIFGWAKPVPITYENLRNPRRDSALVAIAGPAANLLMALLWAFAVKLALILGNSLFLQMAIVGVFINLVLMVLNLLPFPPLDGSRVVSSLVGGIVAYYFLRWEQYGIIVLVVLLLTGILGKIIFPIIGTSFSVIAMLFDFPPGVLGGL